MARYADQDISHHIAYDSGINYAHFESYQPSDDDHDPFAEWFEGDEAVNPGWLTTTEASTDERENDQKIYEQQQYEWQQLSVDNRCNRIMRTLGFPYDQTDLQDAAQCKDAERTRMLAVKGNSDEAERATNAWVTEQIFAFFKAQHGQFSDRQSQGLHGYSITYQPGEAGDIVRLIEAYRIDENGEAVDSRYVIFPPSHEAPFARTLPQKWIASVRTEFAIGGQPPRGILADEFSAA